MAMAFSSSACSRLHAHIPSSSSSSSPRLHPSNVLPLTQGWRTTLCATPRCSHLGGDSDRGLSRSRAWQESMEITESATVLSRRDSLAGLATLSLSGLLFSFPTFPALSVETATAAAACNELSFSASGLGFCDSLPGSGVEAAKGMLIKAHYTGRLENGKVFDSSYNRGKPLTFRVGVGEVIKGWDEGIAGGEGIPAMLAGGKRTLKIPAELAYGERGAGCRGGSCLIPPGSVLLFDVEFVGKV